MNFLFCHCRRYLCANWDILGIKYQITKEKEEKREDYKNDILSMIDLTAYKASKISKIHLSETNALINKPQTLEKCDDVEGLFVKLDDQIQNYWVL